MREIATVTCITLEQRTCTSEGGPRDKTAPSHLTKKRIVRELVVCLRLALSLRVLVPLAGAVLALTARRVVQDGTQTLFHLRVQEVVPRVLEH